jgi:hypothetical protein
VLRFLSSIEACPVFVAALRSELVELQVHLEASIPFFLSAAKARGQEAVMRGIFAAAQQYRGSIKEMKEFIALIDPGRSEVGPNRRWQDIPVEFTTEAFEAHVGKVYGAQMLLAHAIRGDFGHSEPEPSQSSASVMSPSSERFDVLGREFPTIQPHLTISDRT